MDEDKARLRAEALARRAALSPEQRAAAALAIARYGLEFLDIAPDAVVAGYCAIGAEIDPRHLLARLDQEGVALCLPVLRERGQPLRFRRWRPGDPLRAGIWSIREPLQGAADIEPGILLVPLLAFDAAGRRLGYGGGYYDRALAALRAGRPIAAVGLAFDEQEVDAVPRLDYDERLDWVLTPSGPRRCHGG